VTAVAHELDLEGPAAPPRSNGELVFQEPWQARAFGLAMALTEGGTVPYDAFRDHLIARIVAWEAAPPAGEPYSYYAHWLQALEDVLAAQSLVTTADVDARSGQYAARPPGHDHTHGHEPGGDGHHDH